MNKLKYLGYTVVFQEVPNEVSLAVNISGCPHKCEGCHSQYLWKYEGNYISDDLSDLIKKYENLITCVCFMGGEQNPSDLIHCLITVKQFGLKTCIYSGSDSLEGLVISNIAQYCDYIKIGRYDKKKGGLNNRNTNQKFFRRADNEFIDVTHLFWTKQHKGVF